MKSTKYLIRSGWLLYCILVTADHLAAQSVPLSTKTYTKESDGVSFSLKNAKMKIYVYAPDIIRVAYTSLGTMPEKRSLVVVGKWAAGKFQVSEKDGQVLLTTGRLKVRVNESTGSIQYADLNDRIILAEVSTGAKRMTDTTIAGIQTHTCETRFNSPADEALYGLGCHPEDTGAMNYKGRNQDLAIRYLTGAIPVLLSNKGYGLLWDNYSASNFYGAESANSEFKYVSESGKMIDYYFFYGPELDHVVSLYRTTTGPAPMFPKWAYGLFQSQDRYKSQAEILTVKDNYRNNHIPVDCIVQDWFYWEPYQIGSHIMNPVNYPNPKALVDELHKANIHAMISIWPCMAPGSRNFDELKNAGGLTDIKWDNVMTHHFDTYYDAHNPKARAIYWRQAKDSLIARYGWDAWWIDQCEPDNGSLLDVRKQSNFAIGKGIDYFNTYALMHTTGTYQGWRKDIPGKRAFFLARQAFAGQQRNAATLWSSDITCTFKSFKIQVPQGINTCASGYPYWTSDIGGYHFHWTIPDWSTPGNRELFTRWFQFGTFCPVFRIHGKGERALFSKNWDDTTRAILLNFDNLRYRLMPYIYSLAWRVTDGNYTIMRALAFDFRNDPLVNNIRDQYMFGPAFMVNPVTDSMGLAGMHTRKVYLPASTDWYDFWNGSKLKGGQTIEAPAPVDILPLYVKAGSVVPMGPFLQYATEKAAGPVELRIYTGANGQFTVYEDENDTYNYEKGAYATFTISWNDRQKKLSISGRKGSFPGMLRERRINVVLVSENHGSGVAITEKADKSLLYTGQHMEVQL